jgi:hypothetical protein
MSNQTHLETALRIFTAFAGIMWRKINNYRGICPPAINNPALRGAGDVRFSQNSGQHPLKPQKRMVNEMV